MKTAKKHIAVALAASMLVSACATSGGQNPDTMTPAEKRMHEQADTFNQTVAEGAVAGCVLGAVIGVLASNNHKGGGAAMGCAAGAAVGGLTGYAVASKQEGYANEEARLDQMAADIRKDNERIAGLIDSSKQVIAADKAKIDEIEKQLAAGKITKDKAKSELASVDANTKYLADTLDNLKKRKDEYAQARDAAAKQGQKSAEADKEIATLEQQIAELQGNVDSLVQRRKVSRVG